MLNHDSPGTPIKGAAALVTGGNRGFGRAIVEELLDRGAAKVYATARSPHTQPDKRIVPLVLDVTDDDSVAAAARSAGRVKTSPRLNPTSAPGAASPTSRKDARFFRCSPSKKT